MSETTAAGVPCERCGQPIGGTYIYAEGKFMHPPCYEAALATQPPAVDGVVTSWAVDSEAHYWAGDSLPTVAIDFNGSPPHGAKIEIHAEDGMGSTNDVEKAQRAINAAIGLAHRIAAFLNSDTAPTAARGERTK